MEYGFENGGTSEDKRNRADHWYLNFSAETLEEFHNLFEILIQFAYSLVCM
jgi:hypothetical protein